MSRIIGRENTLWDFLSREPKNPNESSKLITVIRILTLAMVVYGIAIIGFSAIELECKGLPYAIAMVIAFAAIFFVSYKLSTLALIAIDNLAILAWVYVAVRIFGWGCGINVMIFVLFILAFFSAYKKNLIKIVYSLALVAYHLGMYMMSRRNAPVISLTENETLIVQIITTLVAFVMIGFVCYVFSDESQEVEGKLVEYNIQLENEANTDALTGLYNRRKGREHLSAICAPGINRRVVVAMLDIDFFKHVNDSYGHDVGDEVLKKLAETMRETFVTNTSMVRWGGEEFLIIFEEVNGDEACVKLQELSNKIRNLRFNIAERSFSITVTIGVEEFDYASEVDAFVKRADEKLYKGKEAGRDRIVF